MERFIYNWGTWSVWENCRMFSYLPWKQNWPICQNLSQYLIFEIFVNIKLQHWLPTNNNMITCHKTTRLVPSRDTMGNPKKRKVIATTPKWFYPGPTGTVTAEKGFQRRKQTVTTARKGLWCNWFVGWESRARWLWDAVGLRQDLVGARGVSSHSKKPRGVVKDAS